MPYSNPPRDFFSLLVWFEGFIAYAEGGASDVSGAANLVYASPDGAPGLPSLRALVAADIPNISAAKVTSGTLDAARIPNLDASKITTGTLDAARIPSLDTAKVTSGTFDAARIPSLDASKITTGTLDNARINFASPGTIGTTTPSTGAFTTLKYNTLLGNFASYNGVNTIPADVSVVVGFGGSGFTLTLPSVASHRDTGFAGILAVKSALSAGNLTLARAGADTIDNGLTSVVLSPAQGIIMFATESGIWRRFGDI